MPVISVAVGKSKYQIDCPIEEEERIKALSEKVNEKVNNLSLSIRGANEKTILMLCAIMIQEEMEALKSSDSNNKKDSKPKLIDANNSQYDIIILMDDIAKRIEKLANKIQDY